MNVIERPHYLDAVTKCFGNLRAIKDNYPKYVISMTPLVTRSDADGIIHLHLRRFLLDGLGLALH
ncbi:MAG: hypothetical protein PUB53_05610 [Bacteroidales bacterium]|nr:hypothetical protein [Bacteroidales bacterium]